MNDDIAWHDDPNDTERVSIEDAAILSGMTVAELVSMMVAAGHLVKTGPDEYHVSDEALALGIVTKFDEGVITPA